VEKIEKDKKKNAFASKLYTFGIFCGQGTGRGLPAASAAQNDPKSVKKGSIKN
jgi:hypothetical protein